MRALALQSSLNRQITPKTERPAGAVDCDGRSGVLVNPVVAVGVAGELRVAREIDDAGRLVDLDRVVEGGAVWRYCNAQTDQLSP
jgi:hypothetical protein